MFCYSAFLRIIFASLTLRVFSILILLQLKIRNDFDPVISPESSLFVLKSNKQASGLYDDSVEDLCTVVCI